MRWLMAPLVAATLMSGSGFLDALELTTKRSVDLARTSKDAPERARAGVEEVASLPQIADLTTQQANAFDALADALQLSAERVFELNDSLNDQVEGLDRLAGDIESLDAPISCARERIAELASSSRQTPPVLREIGATLDRIIASQNKSIRHLRSINRKLTALGVAATAQGVEPPPPPGNAPPATAEDEASPLKC